jgi:hypothetical protein
MPSPSLLALKDPAPAPATRPAPPSPLEVKVELPRCPYCHDDVLGGEPQHGCPGCRAWHHAACWSESAACCAACGREDVWTPAPRPAPPASARLLLCWTFLALAIPYSQATVLPAFQAMFREVGCRLPHLTEFALGPWRWGLAMLPLTALFLAAQARTEGQREGWWLASGLLTAGLVLFYAWALFLPLVTLITHL